VLCKGLGCKFVGQIFGKIRIESTVLIKEKILVTGGTGYIGSHTVVELLKRNYEVIVIDNLSNSYEWILDNIVKICGKCPEFYKIDLRNREEVIEFFQSQKGICGVIHFAAFKSVGESVQNPNMYYYNNLFSLINLVDGMLENQINRIIFSSSCTVYGEPINVPIDESAPLSKASSPYGNTKRISEEILFDNTMGGNLNVISLRYFNPVGAHESALIGELPLGEPQSLIPVITRTCIGKRDKMFVHGNDYPTPDGTAIRDYFHVSDLAVAHIKAFEYLKERKNNEAFTVFNLGSDEGYSVLEMIEKFEIINKVKVNYEMGPRRSGDIVRIYADSSKAKKELGWSLQNDLDDMVRSAWHWELYLKERNL
jgi:UDP-glucose 4-epimerase